MKNKMPRMKTKKHDGKSRVASWKAGTKSMTDRRTHFTWQDRGNRLLALVAGVILIVGTGCQSDTYTHSQFRERSARLTNVALLPPNIKTGTADIRWLMPAGAPLPEEKKIRADLPGLIASEFRNRGFVVKECAPESLRSDATNQVWNPRLRGILTSAYGSLGLKTVRPEAKVLADHVQADGLVFLNVFAYKSTDGRKAWVALGNTLAILSAAGGGYCGHTSAFSQGLVQITLVDGATGDVLWRTIHDFTDFEQTELSKAVAELMKKYPRR